VHGRPYADVPFRVLRGRFGVPLAGAEDREAPDAGLELAFPPEADALVDAVDVLEGAAALRVDAAAFLVGAAGLPGDWVAFGADADDWAAADLRPATADLRPGAGFRPARADGLAPARADFRPAGAHGLAPAGADGLAPAGADGLAPAGAEGFTAPTDPLAATLALAEVLAFAARSDPVPDDAVACSPSAIWARISSAMMPSASTRAWARSRLTLAVAS